MLREAAYNPKDIDDYLDEIERIDPERLKEYEKATGIALAKSNVDLARVRGEDWRSQERRLMPEFVEGFFLRASETTGLQLDLRADGLWRAEHVPAVFRMRRLRAVKRLGRPDAALPKFTFRKDQARESKNLDSRAGLAGPSALRGGRRGAERRRSRSTRQGVARISRSVLAASVPVAFLRGRGRGRDGAGRIRAGDRDPRDGRRGRRQAASSSVRPTSSTT